ncbi:MAG: hypothetical protein N2111_08000 [Candidatus Sumerlaeaceae bacterium]|nr:hypothetical protein [Candidatus Sumerlaeaceae bacterium]
MDAEQSSPAPFDKWFAGYKWLSEYELPCIVSADLDGIACALLQISLLGWRAVGTYDGYKLCLFEPVTKIDWPRVVFVDVEVLRRETRSIGNHMLTWNDMDAAQLAANLPDCANPNLWQGLHVENGFQRKYPFGTLPMLLAGAAARDASFDVSRTWLALALHVDSSFTNAAVYQDNALQWLAWMGSNCTSPGLERFCALLSRIPAQAALGLLNDVQQWVSAAGFGSKARACRFDSTSKTDREKVSKLIDILLSHLNITKSVPFANEPVYAVEFKTDKLPIHTKGRAVSSFLQAREQRAVSMAATGRTSDGLSLTYPLPECPIALFQ